ncbi:caspase family protein [Methylocapsa sp. S129]|uniref:caspase family protein n=1 Tax=Methylocapsa sp. S129 TaxID=1641869 RepID=UPI00131B4601|nr:caspase family protein [Methylocapsa sp. S129]
MTVQMKFMAAMLALLSFVALVVSPTRAQTPAAGQNPRIALIIGNSAYPDHPLATPANDAGLVAQTLQAAGFEVVGARDLDQDTLRGALRDFLAKAVTIGPDMQAFVYLSGRGVQYDGDNYFVPVDAKIARDADVPIQAIKIADFSRALAATPGRARIIVMDAARANSFAADGSPLAGGLGLVDPEDGVLMAFNAAPGTVAPDEPGPYGVYGKSLAGAMREGGSPIDDVFAQVRLQVNQQTNGAVVPWSISKVKEPYSIFERAPDAPPPPAVAAAVEAAKRPLSSFGPDEAYSVALQRDTLAGYRDYLAAYPDSPQARRVRAILAARREAIFWRRSVNENSPRAYWTYLRVYPRGPHVPDAERRLQILAAQSAPPPDFAPLEYADLPPPPPDELVYDTGPTFVFDGPDYGPPPPPPPYAFLPPQDNDWRDLPPPPQPQGQGFLPVLSVAIPLLIGAKIYHDHQHGAAPAQQSVGAPPPLPHGFKPHDHAPGAPAGAAPAVVAPVGAGKPLPGAPGAAPLAQPLNAVKPAPVVPGPANAAQPSESGKPLKPLPTPTEPLAVKPGAQPGTALKPLPTPTEPLVVKPGAQPGAGLKPPPTPKEPLAVKPAVQPGTAPKPLSATPAEPLVVKPAIQPVGGPKPPRPEFKPAPQKEFRAAPQEFKPAPQKEFKAAPIESRPAPQVFKPAPQQVAKPAPVAPPTPHFAPPAPAPHAAPSAPHAAPPAANKRPACGGAHEPPCPK